MSIKLLTVDDSDTIKLLLQGMQICTDLTLIHTMVGNDDLSSAYSRFEESKDCIFFNSLDEAKAAATS